MMKQRISQILAWVGAFGLLISFFYFVIRAQADWMLYGTLIISLLFLGFFMYSNAKDLKNWFQWKRSTSYNFNAIILSLIVLFILALINFVGTRHHKRIDFTENKLFSLSPQSIKVLKALTEEVSIKGFFKPSEKPFFDDLLDKYKYHSDKLKVEFIDPDTNVALTKQYGIKKYQTIVVEKGKREARIEGVEEEKLTNAIIKVGKEKEPIVYFVTGHGEKSVQDKERDGMGVAKEELEKEGYVVQELLLLSAKEVPSDAEVLVIAGPTKPFLKQEVTLLENYLKQGGRLFLLLDTDGNNLGIEPILKEMGVTARNDVAIDPFSTVFGQSAAVPVITKYPQHALTKDMGMTTFYPMARSFEVQEKSPRKNMKVEKILETSEKSWGETGSLKQGTAKKDGNDVAGPLVLGWVAEGNWEDQQIDPKQKMRMVTIGDCDFANNRTFHFSGNGNMFLNSVAWLIEDENMISIRPNQAQAGKLFLTDVQARFMLIFTVVILPLLIIGSGMVVWWRRRRLA